MGKAEEPRFLKEMRFFDWNMDPAEAGERKTRRRACGGLDPRREALQDDGCPCRESWDVLCAHGGAYTRRTPALGSGAPDAHKRTPTG